MSSSSSTSNLLKLSNFINGQFVEPRCGRYIDKTNPATGRVYCHVPDSDAEDVELAVKAAKEAFKLWKNTTARERAALCNKIADLIEQRLQEFAEAESRDQGKTVQMAKTLDIPRACTNFRFFAGAILHHEETSTLIEEPFRCVNYTVRSPVGVSGLISPWNLPLYLLTWKIAPALAAGNTIVCKPSEFTSVTAWMLGDVLNKAGVPPGVVNIVFGTGPRAGAPLVSHPDVPLISFTGGTKTGEEIIKLSAPYYKKLSLELGGKNPNIIFADAKLDECIPTSVRAAFANQGEICLCGSRIFVQDSIFDQFVKGFVEEAKKIVVGNPADPKTTMGALISKEHLAKVQYYINLAKEEGGTIVLGGDKPQLEEEFQDGYFINPTVITNLTSDCRVVQEEIFGPVVTITPFKTEDEVIAYANSVKYGLSASVWTENTRTAHRIAHKIDSGTVWVNCWLMRDLRVPFGGCKQSGIGREGGDHSIDFFTEQKTICMRYA